jgi:hypothetical protein
MSRRRKGYWDLETGKFVHPEDRPYGSVSTYPRTDQELRTDIVDRFRLRRHGWDESWVVLGEKPGAWEIVSPKEQRRRQREQRRVAIAKQYGVPVSHVMLEDELANWKATSATANVSGGFLSKLRLQAQTRARVCLQMVAAVFPQPVVRS